MHVKAIVGHLQIPGSQASLGLAHSRWLRVLPPTLSTLVSGMECDVLDSVLATATVLSRSSAARLASARLIYFRNAGPVVSRSFSTFGRLCG